MKLRTGFFLLLLISPAVADVPNRVDGRLQGKVIDQQTGQALPYANIIALGTLRGTSTSAEGSFTLRLPLGKFKVEARLLGYVSQQYEIEVNADSVCRLDFALAPTLLEFPQVVVTGTRTEKAAEESPVATRVVTDLEIQRKGATDLRDVLAEQPGLNIVQDFSGRGVQIQGLDPDYALILIDGSPVIGRVAGTLDLTRFAVGNLKSVEIVKGPNSSLYGSEALAGVINLITRVPRAPLLIEASGKLGGLSSRDVSTVLETRRKRFGGHFFYNLKTRDHLDLDAQTVSWTLPQYTDHTFSTKLTYQFHPNIDLTLNGRFFHENLLGRVGLLVDSATVVSEDHGKLYDWNLAPTLTWGLSPSAKFTGKAYASRYMMKTKLAAQDGNRVFDDSVFDQDYRQVETQIDAVLSSQHSFKAGASAIFESVAADRIAEGRRHTQNYVAFAQHEWIPFSMLDVIASARIDAHSEYDLHFSPKISALVRLHEAYQLRASVGSGFKAPTFSQLYLDFTNPQVGYSVFGSDNVIEGVRLLQSQGQIRELSIDPSALARLAPESSTAYNLSLETQPVPPLRLRANLFRNDVSNLIDAQPIGRKTNGQSLFTYFNLHRVFTQGLESEAQLNFGERLELALGYQYVIAKDKGVLSRLERGEITKQGSSGRIRAVLPEEYGGLFNRSRNSGTARLAYKTPNGFSANARALVRGKFGLFDVNGNGILDDASEYAARYVLLNVHAAVLLKKTFELAAGAENLLDYIDENSLAGAPGRIVYLKLGFDWKRNQAAK